MKIDIVRPFCLSCLSNERVNDPRYISAVTVIKKERRDRERFERKIRSYMGPKSSLKGRSIDEGACYTKHKGEHEEIDRAWLESPLCGSSGTLPGENLNGLGSCPSDPFDFVLLRWNRFNPSEPISVYSELQIPYLLNLTYFTIALYCFHRLYIRV